jgi:glutamate/tyrosine decarboxylase-like PLP-dependent enzyme
MQNPTEHRPRETSLDPKDWDEFKRFAHAALEESLDSLAEVRERKVWQPVPGTVRERLKAPLPREGEGTDAAYRDYKDLVAPYPVGNVHPRFWGWVMGNGTPMGVVAEMLAATMNVNAGGFDQSSTYVELQVIEWLKQIMGFPAMASGVLVSGGTMANLVGLNAARNALAPFAVREKGVAAGPRLMVYASSETHNSVQRGLELMGMGRDSLAKIPVQDDYRLDLAALKARIAEDRKAGAFPLCVVGNAGTVNTGAVDDLAALADLCATEKLWFHVDGAFGALAMLDPRAAPKLAGLERADSVAFDLHKWMYLQYDVGCVLIRERERHHSAFATQASYLNKLEGGIAAGPGLFNDYEPQLSRAFRALKVWLNLKAYGVDQFARQIAQNVDQAQYLKGQVEKEAELEMLAPVPLNVVNFRYRKAGLSAEALDALNTRILVALQERGIAAPSSTVLKGRFAFRVCITNYRTRREDLDALVQGALALGREFTA